MALKINLARGILFGTAAAAVLIIYGTLFDILDFNLSSDISEIKVFGKKEYEEASKRYPVNETHCPNLSALKPSITICTNDPADDIYISKGILDGTAFEPRLSIALRDALRIYHDSVLLDVGANIGQHSLYAAASTGAKVYSVEPLSINIVKLYHSARLQGTLQNMTLIKNVIEWKRGPSRMAIMHGNIGGSHLVNEDNNNYDEMVEAVLLSDIVGMVQRKKTRSSSPLKIVLKIDIENHECHAFLGSKEIFANREIFIPYIFMEWYFYKGHDANGQAIYSPQCDKALVQELTDLFVKSGYSSYRMMTVDGSWERLNEGESATWFVDIVLWKHFDAPPPVTGNISRFGANLF